MTSIERTAYPRFKQNISKKELATIYTVTHEENIFAHRIARGESSVFICLVMLKSFQRLGYFPRPKEIPTIVLQHIQSGLHIPDEVEIKFNSKVMYRHQKEIRQYLQVSTFGKDALHVATKAIYKAAYVMDHPPDLINVAIEELIKGHYELPAFSTLDRLVRRVRTLVNNQLCHTVMNRLSNQEKHKLDELLRTSQETKHSSFNYFKELPKSPSISHMKELQNKLDFITSFMSNIEELLKEVPNSKVKNFALEALALDASEMKDFTMAKRYTLLLSVIYRSQIITRDHLIDMFLKRIARIHKKGKEELALLREKQRSISENLISILSEVLHTTHMHDDTNIIGSEITELFERRGGIDSLQQDCLALSSYNGNNYLPLLEKFYNSHRKTLFRLISLLKLDSTTQDDSLIKALQFLLLNENRRVEHLPTSIDLSFANEQWKQTLRVGKGSNLLYRKRLEICIFSYLASELKTGDVSVQGSEKYADYRKQLLSWEECEPLVKEYCKELNFPSSPTQFVKQLKQNLTSVANTVDSNYPNNGQVMITEDGEPILKRFVRKTVSISSKLLEKEIIQRLPERTVLDILCNVEHWTHWTKHFGPLSGSDSKLEDPTERYIVTTFGYGCNLGPTQTAKHMRNTITPHMLSFVNRRHIHIPRLNAALQDVLNQYHTFSLPKLWGTGKIAAADGTKHDMYTENLISEYHIRYGGYGALAYHHVADNYIALFSHFIPCGVWEAIYIIDGLLKNKSDIQPDTLHADTQGQSTPVFALSYLLGIQLMPRIRNWKDLKFFRPDKHTQYKHIDPLFKDVIDWRLIETHWKDLFQVVVSIKMGKILPSTLLRKLSSNSKKNRLYQAFQELGRVIRTIFLLQYISDMKLREQITASTNKVEAYNGFSKWLFFGGDGIITENDPIEQEKRIKYNELITNSVIFQNVVDITTILWQLKNEGYRFSRQDLERISPYITRHIKRFGDYVIDLQKIPHPIEEEIPL
ncbi:Tn3 family transposase [Bacillus thuringiensis]|uniref:Tn3 family transposase n=6 Tax=Bacillus thuringiensis TaxID=1428 RepID=A0A9X6M3B3_BACTJ|nr:Tn3 family transposase [Bacillus thuringiensis]OUB64362.1 Tn3 family transposase [Bacillus thuringiensis serovar jegathesan]OUB64469.1 Tn3 family transposase [Bacillus thuringiensis serovar jegathesan]OUB64489.1 Tn3 family transposase [Bacillus thuringiensis serovar jegathesan]OUB72168.1 Tn3 family transposase [Bacillus thuringiensis serovar jegathesan]OUB72424.1 Tn3 family transposase [Bacillus thuringiensis serovar jegathesan]